MKELNNDTLGKVVGGTGVSNGGFKIGDWVRPKKTRISPQGMMTYYRIDDIEEPDSSMPMYVVNVYVKNPFDGSIAQNSTLGTFMADELDYGHNPTPFEELEK